MGLRDEASLLWDVLEGFQPLNRFTLKGGDYGGDPFETIQRLLWQTMPKHAGLVPFGEPPIELFCRVGHNNT